MRKTKQQRSRFITTRVIWISVLAWAISAVLGCASNAGSELDPVGSAAAQYSVNEVSSEQRLMPLDVGEHRQEVRSFSIVGAVRLALQRNPGAVGSIEDLELSRLAAEVAEAEYEIRYIPTGTVGITGGSDFGTRSTTGAGIGAQKRFTTGSTVTLAPQLVYSREDDTLGSEIRASLTQPLLRGASRRVNRASIERAKLGIRATELSREQFLNRLIVDTIALTYGVIEARESVELTSESLRRVTAFVETTRAKQALGIADSIDLLRAEQLFTSATDRQESAQLALAESLDLFRVQLDLGPDVEVDVDAPLAFSRIDIEEDRLVDVALRSRPDVLQARLSVSQSVEDLIVARDGLQPRLDLSLGYTRFGAGSRFENTGTFETDTWTIGLVTSTDLDRSAERAGVRRAEIALARSQRSIPLLEDAVRRQVVSQARQLRRIEESIALFREAVRQADAKRSVALLKFDFGRAGNFNVLQAEQESLDAQLRLLRAIIQHTVGQFRLREASGTLMASHLFHENEAL